MTSSRLMRVLALLLFVGAVILAVVGYRMSQTPTPAERPALAAPDATGSASVVAVQPLEPGVPIRPEDVDLATLPVMPEGGFRSVAEVLNKAPTVAIPAGEPVLARHFVLAGQLAQIVHHGQRAVAINVDEVVMGGGYIQPGDFVDVLLFIKGGSGSQVQESLSQVVLKKVRVLTFGEQLVPSQQRPARDTPERATGKNVRTAVLAVPETDVTRLMLAANAGELRLALYGASEAGEQPPTTADGLPLGGPEGADDWSASPVQAHAITLDELLDVHRQPAKAGAAGSSARAAAGASPQAAPAKSKVLFYR